MFGENSIGMRFSCRAFQAATTRTASAKICDPSARRASASFAAAAARSLSIRRLLKPMASRHVEKFSPLVRLFVASIAWRLL
jgi:hypothetical protein